MNVYHSTIFPYLARRGITKIWGNLHCWNYKDLCDKYIHDELLRKEMTKAIETHEHPEWVNVLWEGDSDTGRPVLNNHVIRKVQLLLMFCTVAKGNVVQNDELWSSSDHFAMATLNVRPGSTEFRYALTPIFKNLVQSFALIPGAVQTPKHIAFRTPDNIKFDDKLLSALVRLQRKHSKQMGRIYDSLEMLFSAMININLTPHSTILIILVAAFENLFVTDRRGVKDALDQIYHGSKKYKTKYEDRMGRLLPDKPRTSVAIWYEHLCRARNRATHGKEILQEHASYGPQSHRYITLLVLISCIKSILSAELGINLKGHVFRFRASDGKVWFKYRE